MLEATNSSGRFTQEVEDMAQFEQGGEGELRYEPVRENRPQNTGKYQKNQNTGNAGKNWIKDPLAPISPAQEKFLGSLISDCELNEKWVIDRVNQARVKVNPSSELATELKGIKKGEASQLIELLNKKKEKMGPPADNSDGVGEVGERSPQRLVLIRRCRPLGLVLEVWIASDNALFHDQLVMIG